MYICIYIYITKYHTYTAHALTLILQPIATICAIPAAPACMQTTGMRCGFLWGQEGWFAAKGCVHTTLASTLRGWDPTAKRRKRRLLLLIPGRPGYYRTLCFRHFLTLRTPCWQCFRKMSSTKSVLHLIQPKRRHVQRWTSSHNACHQLRAELWGFWVKGIIGYHWWVIMWGFPKMVVPNNHGVFLLNEHFGVFWGYHHLRKHPHIPSWVSRVPSWELTHLKALLSRCFSKDPFRWDMFPRSLEGSEYQTYQLGFRNLRVDGSPHVHRRSPLSSQGASEHAGHLLLTSEWNQTSSRRHFHPWKQLASQSPWR